MKKQLLLLMVVFLLGNYSLQAQYITALDNAGNYATYSNGNNAGFGFSAWDLWTQNTSSTAYAGHFLGNSVSLGFGNINTSDKAFAMYGNPAGSFPQANAQRIINNWGDGSKFSIDLAVAYRNGYKGIDLFEPGYGQIWNFNVGGDLYAVNSANLGWSYSQTSVFQLSVTQNGSNLDVVLTRGTDTYTGTITGKTLFGFKLYVGNTGDGNALNNLLFNNLKVEVADPAKVPAAADVLINGTVSLASDKALTCNNLTVSGSNSLTLQSGGSMIVNGSLTGDVTVLRDITGQNKYHFISSPVNNVTIGSVFPVEQYDNIYVRRYDEPTGSWVNLGIADNMATGTGYSFFMNEAATTATFDGSLNNASVTPTLSYAGSGDEDYVNWNLLGNPFASAIDWDNGNWARSGLNGSVYTWDGASGNYLSWSGSAGSLTGGIIPAQQGFFVKVEEYAPTLTIPKDARVHGSGFYKSGESTALELAVTNSVNAYTDKTYLQSNPEATAEFDSQFDAYKLDGETEAPELYTMTGETRLSINSMPAPAESLSIPLYLKSGVEGSFTLTASGLETIGGNVILNDLTSGTLTDLSLNPSYTFQAAPDDDLHRFNLLFSPVGVVETPLLNTGIYSYGKTIFVHQQLAQEGRLSVVNLTGQTMFTQNLGGAGLLSFETRLPAGVYIVRIVSSEGTLSGKVVIR